METELGKFIAVFVMVILPIVITLWAIGSRFNGLDKEITELKKRINELESKKD